MKSAFIQRDSASIEHGRRLSLVLVVLLIAAAGLVVRAVQLQLVEHKFLATQGNQRHMRVLSIIAHRGTITDRYGEPLAVSTPVDSVEVAPKVLLQSGVDLKRLARALKLDPQWVERRVSGNSHLPFVYIARHIESQQAARIRALGIAGVRLTREYRRYYPGGEVTGHVLGFTDVDDNGQEGIELAFDHWLAGANGAKRIIQDNRGRVIDDIESIRETRPGKDLVLSLDLRIQYLAYRELKRAMIENQAKAGSVVVLDIETGEVLAMVNQPAFNPNDREQIEASRYRNRAATDMFEPGSSIKPFVIAAALASGKYTEESLIDASAGYVQVGSRIFRDEHPIGVANLATILAKSSNVGMTMVARSLSPKQIWTTLNGFGFGQMTASGYPGEATGLLGHYSNWKEIGISSISRGYSLQVTPLQLARAYAILGSGGIERPTTFLRADTAGEGFSYVGSDGQRTTIAGRRVYDERQAQSLIHMMESVVTQEGATGVRAKVPGYRVAGKTGTAQKAIPGGYSTDQFLATFAGIVPATRPRLAAVVMIDRPGGDLHQGGQIAAPVFSAVMAGALRLMDIAPDAPVTEEPEALQTTLAADQDTRLGSTVIARVRR